MIRVINSTNFTAQITNLIASYLHSPRFTFPTVPFPWPWKSLTPLPWSPAQQQMTHVKPNVVTFKNGSLFMGFFLLVVIADWIKMWQCPNEGSFRWCWCAATPWQIIRILRVLQRCTVANTDVFWGHLSGNGLLAVMNKRPAITPLSRTGNRWRGTAL